MKTKSKKICLVFVIVAVIWALVIFGLSSDTARESNSLSRTVTEFLIKMGNQDFGVLPATEQKALISKYNNIVREAAHFVVYTIFSFLAFVAISNTTWFVSRTFEPACLTFFFCSAFAFSDEFHQYFVQGRSAEFGDIVTDISGVATGVLFAATITLMVKIVAKLKKREDKNG